MPATLPPPDKAAPAAAAPPAADPKPATAAPAADPSTSDIESKFNAWSETQNEPTPSDAPKEPAKEPPKDEKKAAAAPSKQPAKDDRTATAKEPKEPKELRAQLDKVNGEATTLRETVASLEAKIKDAETKGKDVTALTERLTAREKELEEKDRQIRSLKREEDPAFKQKWEVPFKQAAAIARRSIERLPVTDTKTGEVRAANFDRDFVPFFSAAVREGGLLDYEGIKAMFGEGSQVAISHLTSLIEKNDQIELAKKDANQQWEAEQKEAQAREAVQREEKQNLRMNMLKFVAESLPDFLKVGPDDKEGAELMAKGRALVTAQPQTEKEAAWIHANVFHRAAAYDLAVKRYETLKAENEALKAQNEELKGSEPGKTQRGGSDEAGTRAEKSWEDEVREAAHSA